MPYSHSSSYTLDISACHIIIKVIIMYIERTDSQRVLSLVYVCMSFFLFYPMQNSIFLKKNEEILIFLLQLSYP